MVNTRSQAARNSPENTYIMDRYSDSESETSLPEILTNEQRNEYDTDDLLTRQTNTETGRQSVNQRFTEMNKQITDLTNLLSVLTEKISSSNREGNDLDTVSIGHETRSDSKAELIFHIDHLLYSI